MPTEGGMVELATGGPVPETNPLREFLKDYAIPQAEFERIKRETQDAGHTGGT